MLSLIDKLIVEFDKGLKIFKDLENQMPLKKENSADLKTSTNEHIIALMRVNHSGEVCAQGLYSGQSLFTSNEKIYNQLKQSASEELDHYKITKRRINELGGQTSKLNRLFYINSFLLGSFVSAFGDRYSMGFLMETEYQVEQHLKKHIHIWPKEDIKSLQILRKMVNEELSHAEKASDLGAKEIPEFAKKLMRIISMIMIKSSYVV